MEVHQIYTHSSLRNFTYLLISMDRKIVICIDPFDSDQITAFLEKQNLQLTHIINTHEHFDHVCGNEGLIDRYKARVYGHPRAASSIPGFDEALLENSSIDFDSTKLKVLYTPGHTAAHISLLLEFNNKSHSVFSGDTVFNAGVGNCYNGGNPSIMYDTINDKYRDLDDDVLLYPGHDYLENNLRFTLHYEPGNKKAREILEKINSPEWKKNSDFIESTIGQEREISLFFRLEEDSIQDSLQKKYDLTQATMTQKEVFLLLRKSRDNW